MSKVDTLLRIIFQSLYKGFEIGQQRSIFLGKPLKLAFKLITNSNIGIHDSSSNFIS